MNYTERKNELFNSWEKTINNNLFYYEIYDVDQNFFGIYINSVEILGLSYNDCFLDISILFEFLLKNSSVFSNILNKTCESSDESLDILCYLSLNLFIVEKLSSLLKKLNITDEEMQDCLDLNKINFTHTDVVNYNNYRKGILGVFNKIIDIHSKHCK